RRISRSSGNQIHRSDRVAGCSQAVASGRRRLLDLLVVTGVPAHLSTVGRAGGRLHIRDTAVVRLQGNADPLIVQGNTVPTRVGRPPGNGMGAVVVILAPAPARTPCRCTRAGRDDRAWAPGCIRGYPEGGHALFLTEFRVEVGVLLATNDREPGR